MTDTIRIKVGVEYSFTTASSESVFEVDRAEWEAMSDDEREQALNDYATGELENSVSAYAYVVVVERDGSQFLARVERLPAMTANAPKTPGQCWAALKADTAKVLAEWQEQAGEDQIPYAGAFVNAYAYVLDRMQKLEAGQ